MNYADQQALLSKHMMREEEQRRAAYENHRGPCVPWRRGNGTLGACIYCGKMPDAITQHYVDHHGGKPKGERS